VLGVVLVNRSVRGRDVGVLGTHACKQEKDKKLLSTSIVIAIKLEHEYIYYNPFFKVIAIACILGFIGCMNELHGRATN
jgi:hypothetical protein